MIFALKGKDKLFGVASLIFFFVGLSSAKAELRAKEGSLYEEGIPILLYHRLGPVVADRMTVTTNVFELQLKYIIDHGYIAIPLRQLTNYHLGKTQRLSYRSVVITADDGHRSVYTDMFPLLKKYRIPATLFLYPSAISNASYAMTWDEIKEMKRSGLVDFQSHTFWHPNFWKEKERLKAVEYEHFMEMQFSKSKERLEKELGAEVDMLAWPFGIYDDQLIGKAVEAGYVAALTMERNRANGSGRLMALPRYLISNEDREKAFGRILTGSPCSQRKE